MASEQMELARENFIFRFSARKPRDLQLAEWIAEDTESGRVNVSEVIKDLLYAWYCQRHEIGRLPAPPASYNGNGHQTQLPTNEGREDPDDELVQNLLGASFDNL